MKTVFNNRMCAHVWAQLKQPHGRSGSMRFDGTVLYSYAEPVAHIVAPTDSATNVVLFTSKNWSVTTSSHVSEARSASSQYPQFEVPDLLLGRFAIANNDEFWNPGHEANVRHFQARYAKEFARLMRCTADSWAISNANAGASLKAISHDLLRYRDAFKLPHIDGECPWFGDALAVTARRDRLLNDPKRQAKREASRVQREKAEARKAEKAEEQRRIRIDEAKARVADWLAGGNRLHLMYGDVAGPYALLRVKGDTVQSSMGAECPIGDAITAIRMARIVVSRGQAWRRNGETLPLGNFQVDVIAVDGAVRAGCHRILYSEIDRIGKELGV